jgi:hypothetical protein
LTRAIRILLHRHSTTNAALASSAYSMVASMSVQWKHNRRYGVRRLQDHAQLQHLDRCRIKASESDAKTA